jgi:hypothetical protein
VRVVESGPLIARIAVESTAPNCERLVREITLYDGADQIAIENRMDKIMERRPEGTFFGFPLNVPGGQWRIDIPWAVVRPEIDQLPGANHNYYCVQRWCDLSNERFGVTWVTIDANVMQFAPIRYTPAWGLEPWRTEIDPGGTLYSWVCNNHWETNYRAGHLALQPVGRSPGSRTGTIVVGPVRNRHVADRVTPQYIADDRITAAETEISRNGTTDVRIHGNTYIHKSGSHIVSGAQNVTSSSTRIIAPR